MTTSLDLRRGLVKAIDWYLRRGARHGLLKAMLPSTQRVSAAPTAPST
ncbi:MAG: hypothetical protein ACJ72I_12235 [Pseudonocardiaceae bacterium]